MTVKSKTLFMVAVTGMRTAALVRKEPPKKRRVGVSTEILHRHRSLVRQMVIEASELFGVPAAFITAHYRDEGRIHDARLWVWRRMRTELRLPRCAIAEAFGRDIRRVRLSVLGA